MNRIMSNTGAVAASRSRVHRGSSVLIAAIGVLLAVLLAMAQPAVANSQGDDVRDRKEQAATDSGAATQAIIVGGLAFVLMIGAAGAVLYYTARSRHQDPQ